MVALKSYKKVEQTLELETKYAMMTCRCGKSDKFQYIYCAEQTDTAAFEMESKD